MVVINLKNIVDSKGIVLSNLSFQTAIPYQDLKEWYTTSYFDSSKVGIQELTNLSQCLEIELTDLIDLKSE